MVQYDTVQNNMMQYYEHLYNNMQLLAKAEGILIGIHIHAQVMVREGEKGGDNIVFGSHS